MCHTPNVWVITKLLIYERPEFPMIKWQHSEGAMWKALKDQIKFIFYVNIK
jgi:hypothetical protein